MTSLPIVYLAGPAVFHPGVTQIYRFLKEICARYGLRGLTPLDQPPQLDGLEPLARAKAIRQANQDKIRACAGVIACISPFRGPGADAGTAWEMGYAEALGKPVVAWCEDPNPYFARVPHQMDEDGRAFCQQHGMEVENFGLADNLMLAAGAHPVEADFDAAVKTMAALLRS